MRTLFESMRDYQFEKVREQPDKALEDTRMLTDEDLMRYAYMHMHALHNRECPLLEGSQCSHSTTHGSEVSTPCIGLQSVCERLSICSKYSELL